VPLVPPLRDAARSHIESVRSAFGNPFGRHSATHSRAPIGPRGKVVGISKLSRLIDAYGRRLQLQERLTRQIARTIEEVLEPKGVAVVIEASHGCMSTRGVNQHGIPMVTKCWLGDFRSDPPLRREPMESLRDTAADLAGNLCGLAVSNRRQKEQAGDLAVQARL
jgi:hypothetical protein